MAMLPDGRVLLFGGMDESGNVLGDTWLFGPETSAQSLAPLGGVELALRAGPGWRAGGTVKWLFSVLPAPARSPDPEDWSQLNPPNSPTARFGHSMVSLPDGRVVLFGGEGENGLNNDLFIFPIIHNAGVVVAALNAGDTPPSPRRDHIAWYHNDKMYVMGGLEKRADGTYLIEDLWRYDIPINTWEQLQNPADVIPFDAYPSPSAYPIIFDDKVYLVDPHPWSATGGTVQIYDMKQDRWEQGKQTGGFPSRGGTMMAQVDSNAYMLGGEIRGPDAQTWNCIAEVWVLDLTTLTWTRLEDMPYPVCYGVGVYDPLQDRIIVWGGKQSEGVLVPGNKTLIYYFER